MKSYEGVFIFKPDLDKDGLDRALSQVQEIFTKNKALLDKTEEWGKKKLAYPIRKHKEGAYYLMHFQIGPDDVGKVKKAFGLNESILRAMITKT